MPIIFQNFGIYFWNCFSPKLPLTYGTCANHFGPTHNHGGIASHQLGVVRKSTRRHLRCPPWWLSFSSFAIEVPSICTEYEYRYIVWEAHNIFVCVSIYIFVFAYKMQSRMYGIIQEETTPKHEQSIFVPYINFKVNDVEKILCPSSYFFRVNFTFKQIQLITRKLVTMDKRLV